MLRAEEVYGLDIRDILISLVRDNPTDREARLALSRKLQRNLDESIISVWAKRLGIRAEICEARDERAVAA